MKKQNWMPVGIVEQIEKHDFAIKHAREYLAKLSADRQEWVRKLYEQARSLIQDPKAGFDLEHGHRCNESPVGVCVYTDYDDEYCEYCGGPDERK